MWIGEEQETNAVKAALEIREELQKNRSEKYDGLQVGLGINTGEVILGMIGSQIRADYTFIGDNVNTASRLCDAAEPNQMLVADSTYSRISTEIDVEGPFRLKAKGKNEYIKVYKLKGIKE